MKAEVVRAHNMKRYVNQLSSVEKTALISFWEIVEMLETNKVTQLVGESYHNLFVESQEIPMGEALDKELLLMQVGNKDVFKRIQGDAYETMKEHHYPSFLVSKLYEKRTK
ncbi:unnamed protein product [Coregonus sp. 'balchen']|nr:unnamed protein product [Coregonus sp. 'balchen']